MQRERNKTAEREHHHQRSSKHRATLQRCGNVQRGKRAQTLPGTLCVAASVFPAEFRLSWLESVKKKEEFPPPVGCRCEL